MKKRFLIFLLVFTCKIAFSQVETRISLTSFSSSINTGQNYSPWLNDDINDLVTSVWTALNQQYVDVTLPLEKRGKISRVSLYDYEDVFTAAPAYIYAQNGTQRTLLGIFIGDTYMNWVDVIPSQPILADAIVIHKYGNNIPQKIKVFGFPEPVGQVQSIISFPVLPDKTVGDAPFTLVANSNNTEVPIRFTSSNPSVVSVSNASGTWKGTVIAAGSANITASQAGNNGYLAASNVVRTQVVQSSNTYQIVPGKIEAERFDGINGNIWTASTQDVGGGLYVSGIDDNGWLDYKVNVAVAGTYTFNFRVATNNSSGKMEIRNMAGNTLNSLDVPNTNGWNNWLTISTTAYLPTGNQTLRIFAKKGGWNFNWFEVAGISQVQAVITFPSLANKRVGDPPFNLSATSTNTQIPVTFTSSNPAVVSVSNTAGVWKATIIKVGVANIIASQSADNNFTAPAAVTNTQTVVGANGPSASVKIPIDGKRWYQLNNTSGTLEKLFDGQTTETPFPGWGLILSNFDAYYPLQDGESMTIEGIRMFDGERNNVGSPMTLSVITDTWQRIPIASFTGLQYMTWVGPYPERTTGANIFKLDVPVKNARYLVINTSWAYPTEMELYGTYTASTPASPVSSPSVKLKDAFGVNAFEWDFEAPNNPSVIDEQRMTAIKNFTGVRHYMDWEKLELTEGSYTYNPTYSGGWNYDTIYTRCKAEGIEVLACLKTQPGWMQRSYPVSERDDENVPVRYGKDFNNPNSYIEQAKIAFQYAARYGNNKNVNPALLSVNKVPRWTNDQVNVVKIGMGVIKYIECDNERDKWWKGRKAYQTGREYAANLSAFYDGNKNTMGAGVGVKNADPSMSVVMGGTALASTDYVRGMIDWCKQNRGYKPNGTINLCWDVINYHLYSNDAQSSQSGNSTRGAAPEVSEAGKVAADFVETAHKYAYDMPVWVTECGYDVNQGSPLKAIAIGKKTVLQTQADWILRTALLYVRYGVQKVFFYQMYDGDINSTSQFASMGLINTDMTRKPAADFLNQTNKLFGNYHFKETLHNEPIVDRYELNDTSVFMLVMPTEASKTKGYTLNLGNADSAIIYLPKIGSNKMDEQKVRLTGGQLNVTVTETPLFVKAVSNTAATRTQNLQGLTDTTMIILSKDAGIQDSAVNKKAQDIITDKEDNNEHKARCTIYPNPAADYINIELMNGINGNVQISIMEPATGRMIKMYNFKKQSGYFLQKVDIGDLKGGFYTIIINQGKVQNVKKMIKVFE